MKWKDETKLKRPMTALYPYIQMFMVMALRQQAPGSSENQAQFSTKLSSPNRIISSQTSSRWETTALRSHILWGLEMLTDRQVTKWQSEFRMLHTWAMARNVSDQFHRARQKHSHSESVRGSRKTKSLSFPLLHHMLTEIVLGPCSMESLEQNKNLKSEGTGQRLGVTMKRMGLEVFYKHVWICNNTLLLFLGVTLLWPS